jgi:imidazole glycerol-phosphate synthase subunit HisH
MPFAVQIAVCETGLGNVWSVVRAVERAAASEAPGAHVSVTPDPDRLRRADVVVVPGQGTFGAFARAMRDGRGLGEALVETIGRGTPYLGICLGLQVLFEASEEAEGALGLGVLGGRVHRLVPSVDPATRRPLPLPHMGWNTVAPTAAGGELFDATPRSFYFAHSYAARPDDRAVVAGTVSYGEPIVAAVRRGNLVGVQFHPEKSQRAGIALLERYFSRIAKGASP